MALILWPLPCLWGGKSVAVGPSLGLQLAKATVGINSPLAGWPWRAQHACFSHRVGVALALAVSGVSGNPAQPRLGLCCVVGVWGTLEFHAGRVAFLVLPVKGLRKVTSYLALWPGSWDSLVLPAPVLFLYLFWVTVNSPTLETTFINSLKKRTLFWV